jgi:hypothetical protein
LPLTVRMTYVIAHVDLLRKALEEIYQIDYTVNVTGLLMMYRMEAGISESSS